MSQQIENQIVKMQFDNGSFEKNCKESMSTLDKLKKALKFDKVDMSPLQNDMDKLNMDKIEQSCDAVTKKFSLFGTIADQIVRDLTSKFVDMGEKMVKSFTIDQVAEGWSKYAEKTSAIQTIMANSVKDVGEGLKWANQEEQMAAVTEQIEKMNWYTDETSYSLTDMTNNLGKFLAQSVELETATDAMMGIASWAAISGQKKQQAEMAMYNLSQALGAGAVKAIDWKSIENANMATAEFKETVIETAKELGVLDKESNEIVKKYITAKKYNGPAEVSIENFRETLSAGWFNSDVLMTSLEKYGGFATKINELYNTVNRDGMVSTTSALLKTLENVKSGATDVTKEIGKIAKAADMEYEDLKFMFDELAKPEYDLGRRAFAAAQEAKTFQEAIEATSDAVASEWMGIFEAIFGNYLEAKELWTDLSNSLWDIFAGPLDNIKWALKEWKDAETDVFDASEGNYKKMAGREMLLQAVCNIINNIGEAIEVVRSALAEVFPIFRVFVTEGEDAFDTSEAADGILAFTKRLYEFSQALALTDDAADSLHTVVKLLATGIKVSFDIIGGVLQGIFKLVKPVFNILDAVFGLVGKLISSITGNENMSKFADKINSGADSIKERYLSVMDKVAEVLNKIAEAIRSIPNLNIGKKIGQGFKDGVSYVKRFWDEFKEMPVVKQMVDDFNRSVETIEAKFRPIGKTVRDTLGSVKTDIKATFNFENLNKVLTNVYEKLKKGLTVVKEFASKVKQFFKDLKNGKSIVDSFKDNFGDIIDKVKELRDNIVDFFEKIFAKGDELGSKFNLAEIQKAIHDFVANITPEQITMIAIAGTFLIIALNLLKLSDALTKAAEAFTGIGTSIKNVINSYIKKQKSTILQVAEAIVIVAAALWVLSTIPKNKLENAVSALITLTECLIALTAVMTIAGLLMFNKGGEKSLVEMSTGMVMVAGALMVAALSLKVLENVKLDGVLPKIAVLAGIMVGLVGLSMLMGKLDKFKKGSITMLVAAGSLLLAAEALKAIGSLPTENIETAMSSLFKIMVGLAAITYAAGKVGVFSAIGLIAIVLTIDKILPSIERIVNYDYSTIESGLQKNEDMLKKLGGLLLIMTGIGMLAGNRMKGAGIAMISIAGTFAILVGVSKLAGKMRPSELRQGESFLIKMAGIIALIELCSAKSKVGMWGGKAGGEGSKAFIRIAVAMGILLGIAKLASMMKPKDLIKGELALAGLVAIIGGMVLVAKYAGKTGDVIKSIAAMLVGISVVLAMVALLSMIPLKNMVPALASILGIIVALALLARAISSNTEIHRAKKTNWGGVIALVSSVMVICSLGYIISEMAKQPIKNVAASAAAIVAVIGAVAILMRSLGKVGNVDKKAYTTACQALFIVGTVAIVIGALSWAMNKLNIKPEVMISAAGAVAITLLAITPALAVLGNFKGNAGQYEKMKTAVIGAISIIAVLALALTGISRFGGDSEKIIASAVGVAIGLIAVCAPIAVLGAVGKFVQRSQLGSLQKVIIGALELLGGVALAIIAVSRFGNPDSIVQSAQGLAICLIAISVPIAVLGAVGKFCSSIGGGGLAAMGASVLGAILALGGIAGILVWFANHIDQAQVEILNGAIPALVTAIGGVAVLALAIVAAGLISGEGAAIVPGMAAILAAIAALGLIIAAVAFLGSEMNKYGIGADNALIKGLDTVVLVASKLGEAAGSFIGNVGKGITDQLGPIGDNINLFADKMKDFSNKMADINPDAVEGCKNIAAAMLYITAAEFVNGIASFISLGGGLDIDFASLGYALYNFCMTIKDIPGDAVTKASACSVIAKRLAETSSELDVKGGLSGLIFGDKESLKSFGEGVTEFGKSLKVFCEAIQGLPENSVELSQRAADAAVPVIDMSKTLTREGGLVQTLVGEKDLSKFGTNLGMFATSLKLFVMRLLDLENISPTYGELIQRCADATSPMVDLANGIENSGGKLADVVGDNTLDAFGQTLIPFANCLRIFVARLNSMASETPNYYSLISSSVTCTKKLVELANELENIGGLKAAFSGDNTLSKFGDTLVSFGESLSIYSKWLSETDISLLYQSNNAVNELVALGGNASGVSAEAFNGLTLGLQQLSQLPIATLTNEVNSNTPLLVTAYNTLFTNLVTIVNNRKVTDATAYTSYGTALVDAIKNGINRQTAFVMIAVTTLCNGIKTRLGLNMPASAFNVYGTNVTSGIASGIYAGSGSVISAASATANVIGSTLLSLTQNDQTYNNYDKAYEAGKYVAEGLANGIKDHTDLAVDAAKRMADKVNDALPKQLGERSPSRIAYRFGMYYDQGLANGITDYAGVAITSTQDMADDIISTANTIVNAIAAAMDANIDNSPVIRPVLDTSDLEYKASNIGRMFDDNDLALAYSASAHMKAIAPSGESMVADEETDSVVAPAASITFTQNNYSPKALDRYTIYRNTKNQISQLKGALG